MKYRIGDRFIVKSTNPRYYSIWAEEGGTYTVSGIENDMVYFIADKNDYKAPYLFKTPAHTFAYNFCMPVEENDVMVLIPVTSAMVQGWFNED